MKKVACPLFVLFVLLMFILLEKVACPLFAEDMAGASYRVKQGTFCASGANPGGGAYSLQDIVGVNTGQVMLGGQYAINAGFFYTNSAPTASTSSYNDGRPVDDETPTLTWTYTDKDNDTQKRYQLQVGHAGFVSPVVDTGITASSGTSYTTSILPRTEERTQYQWRVRVNDGFGWSGWAQASNGFILAKGGFEIGALAALTAPGARAITPATWQTDNDPYFYWEPPATGIEVNGYSYALDDVPDEEIDTTSTFYYFSAHSIPDGTHSFYVRAQRSSGIWGEPAGFDLWVDTTPPAVTNMTPNMGSVVASDEPQIGAAFTEAGSGIDPQSIQMRINQSRVEPVYNDETQEVSFIPTIPLSDGEQIISLEAYDSVGNYSVPLTWSFVIDTVGPSGSLLINNGDEMTTTNMVTLNISAQDTQSLIAQMMLSNDGVFDTEVWESYTAMRRNWVLPAISGTRTVSVRLKDEAGNISETFSDEISLVIIAPQTYILSGPSGLTKSPSAQFTFNGSLADCWFSYKFNTQDWSEWSGATSASKADLAEGNHYFMVRAAKDLNNDGILQLDEVDPTPAQRVWTVSTTGALQPPATPAHPIKHWQEE